MPKNPTRDGNPGTSLAFPQQGTTTPAAEAVSEALLVHYAPGVHRGGMPETDLVITSAQPDEPALQHLDRPSPPRSLETRSYGPVDPLWGRHAWPAYDPDVDPSTPPNPPTTRTSVALVHDPQQGVRLVATMPPSSLATLRAAVVWLWAKALPLVAAYLLGRAT